MEVTDAFLQNWAIALGCTYQPTFALNIPLSKQFEDTSCNNGFDNFAIEDLGVSQFIGLVASDAATTTRSSDDAIEPRSPDASWDLKADHLVYLRESYVYIHKSQTFLNQAHVLGFLKLLWFAHWYVCLSLTMCPPLRALITSGVIWCDIGHVRLVIKVSRLFSAFNYFMYMTLTVDKMDGCGHINTAHHERLPKKTKVTRY